MSTTNLFVELIVIGLGAAIGFFLILIPVLGLPIELVALFTDNAVRAALALPFVYLIGIVVDRVADRLFQSLRMDKKRESYEGGASAFYRDRALALDRSEVFAQHYEYSRSRQRICRGWVFNTVILIVGLNIYLWNGGDGSLGTHLVGSAALALLGLGCLLSWEWLSDTELKRIKSQADVARDLGARDGTAESSPPSSSGV